MVLFPTQWGNINEEIQTGNYRNVCSFQMNGRNQARAFPNIRFAGYARCAFGRNYSILSTGKVLSNYRAPVIECISAAKG